MQEKKNLSAFGALVLVMILALVVMISQERLRSPKPAPTTEAAWVFSGQNLVVVHRKEKKPVDVCIVVDMKLRTDYEPRGPERLLGVVNGRAYICLCTYKDHDHKIEDYWEDLWHQDAVIPGLARHSNPSSTRAVAPKKEGIPVIGFFTRVGTGVATLQSR